MPATIAMSALNTRSCTNGSNCAYLHGPDSFPVSTGGRNACLAFLAAFLAELPCAGYAHVHNIFSPHSTAHTNFRVDGWGLGWGEYEASKVDPAAEITEATLGA